MLPLLTTLLALHQPAPPERAAFVTRLGSDTVVVEAFTRTASRIEGDIVVRVPGAVLFHYVVDLAADGTPTRSVLDMNPLAVPTMVARRTTVEFRRDSLRVTIDSAGQRRRESRVAPLGAIVSFMTGFDASYGLYSSLGLYELLTPRLRTASRDTTLVPDVHLGSARSTTRAFVRTSPTQLDVDYFRMAWTHLALDTDGHITSADARGTTEQTLSSRAEFIDVPRMAKDFAARDRAGRGLGVASPNQIVRATVGSANVVVAFGSPRRRGRTILGDVVPYDRVWRTGANSATVLSVDRDIVLGTTHLPVGSYSLWTIPTRDGATLVINKQAGQWGTDHDAARDIARVPLRTTHATPPQDTFSITIDGPPNARELRIAWDTFLWSAPIVVAPS